jgi:hypothetical protein
MKRAKNLTPTEVLERWVLIHPPRGADRRPLADVRAWIREKLRDHIYVNTVRKRLADLGWYMKELKEPIAKAANELFDEQGVFWSGRYKSIAVLDEAALLATSVYIDLNPHAAGMAELPEEADFTSLQLRWRFQCTAEVAGRTSGGLWLCPIEDRRELEGDAARAGLLAGLTLPQYLEVLDDTARMQRDGKAQLGAATAGILQRLCTTVAQWTAAIASLNSEGGRLRGVYFSLSRERLREAAASRGCHHVDNLNSCQTDLTDHP